MEASKITSKKPIIIILGAILLLCCLCFTILGIIGATSTPEINSLNSSSDNWEAENQTEYLKFSCTYVSNISINGNKLSSDQVSEACNKDKGYAVKLQNGSNNYKVEVSNLSQNSSKTLDLVVHFDLQKYQVKVAKEEELKKQQELANAEKLKQDQLAQQQKDANLKATQQAQANKPKVGDSLFGPSFKQIKDEYNTQKELSTYKGDQYLKGLQGTQIQWIAEISDVKEEWIGDDLYISLTLSGGVFPDHAYIYNPSKELLALNKGQIIKVTATIKNVSDTLGVSVDLKNATFEIIN